jgi:hypothetical protein
MFLKEKFDSQGVFEKLKARLVANGAQQDRVGMENTDSPTASTVALYLMLAIAAKEGRKASTHDIGTAFLNAKMTGEVVHMELEPLLANYLVEICPEYESYVSENGKIVVKLDRALYGCVQSAKLWYDTLKAALIEFGYCVNEMDPCVFNKTVDGVKSTLLVHVDDILCLCKLEKEHDDLAAMLKAKFGESKCHKGEVLSFLGMTIDLSVRGKVTIKTEGYVKDILAEYGVEGVAESPATNKLFKVLEGDKLLPEDKRERFHKFVAKLLYLTRRTRPDIAVAVTYLCTKVQKATEGDQVKLDRVMKYLNNTQDDCVVLSASDNLQLVAYIDASYGVHADGKSHSGLYLTIGKGPVLVRSSKQKLTARSSTEAELVALSDNVTYVIWARDFLLAQGYEVGPAVIYQDNQSTIAMVKQSETVQVKSKHIKVRRSHVKELVDDGSVVVEYKPTGLMVADVLTKALQGNLFRRMRGWIRGYL